jgi:prevent-host-death family protein
VPEYGSDTILDSVASWRYIYRMKTVGLRELKNRLAQYVRDVHSGEGILVTDRGEVVAELVPPGHPTGSRGVPSTLVALAKGGRLTLGVENDAAAYPKLSRLLKRGRAAQLFDEERGVR